MLVPTYHVETLVTYHVTNKNFYNRVTCYVAVKLLKIFQCLTCAYKLLASNFSTIRDIRLPHWASTQNSDRNRWFMYIEEQCLTPYSKLIKEERI